MPKGVYIHKTGKESNSYGHKLVGVGKENHRIAMRNRDMTFFNTLEYKEKQRVSHLGEKYNMTKEGSLTLAKNALKNNINAKYWKTHKGFREDLGMTFLSSWEANFARLLNYYNVEWEYNKMIALPDNTKYFCDFYLLKTNQYIEVKGYVTKMFIKKVRQIDKSINLKVLDSGGYKILNKKYSKVIEKWEN